jgi:hypothetical protein
MKQYIKFFKNVQIFSDGCINVNSDSCLKAKKKLVFLENDFKKQKMFSLHKLNKTYKMKYRNRFFK